MRWSNITERIAPLAVSLGDPAGVGPELICEAWARREAERLPPFVVVGSELVLQQAAAARGIEILTDVLDDRPAGEVFATALPLVDGFDSHPYCPGQPDDKGAEMALAALEFAADWVCKGYAGGLVTGPVSKAEIARVEPSFVGQTEACAKACGVAPEDAVMLLAGPRLRTVPLTVHVALADVPTLLSEELIVRRARIVARAMREDFGIASPRLALTGLNPHAGESGRMGREEIEVIAPAVAALRAEGIDATGPHPADTLFAPRARETYDVAIAMYHDQALVPLKALDFDQGVNVTLGLPIVRTSPDHGTAFDIAGKGIADPGAMIAAIRMAGEIAARRAAAR
jgi:4-hydroxythreonine-4-phosphate dehydrogenase